MNDRYFNVYDDSLGCPIVELRRFRRNFYEPGLITSQLSEFRIGRVRRSI